MDENNIIKKCQEHDLSAYKMIYDRYGQPLLHTALRILGRQQDAEDAVQKTFLNLYKGINNYDHRAKFSTYLFRILINNCYDMLRKKGRKQEHPLEDKHGSHSPDLDANIYLREAIKELPDRMRTCFVLFAVEEFKQTEIAKMLNMSVGGVKSTIFQAKSRLRAKLSYS